MKRKSNNYKYIFIFNNNVSYCYTGIRKTFKYIDSNRLQKLNNIRTCAVNFVSCYICIFKRCRCYGYPKAGEPCQGIIRFAYMQREVIREDSGNIPIYFLFI